MRLQWRLALIVLTAAVFAACGGGGGGAGGTSVVPGAPNKGNDSATITIKIPRPSSTTAARHGNYISPNTQSIGVVVAPQGLPTESPQYVNLASCPTVGGVETCSINVTVWVGSDTFTITEYSGQNGTGSVLGVGSVVQTIASGGTAPTVSVSLGGVISNITLTTVNATLPLSQSMTFSVVAKDASGAAIVGTYDNPITISATNSLNLAVASIADSNAGSNITASWAQGYLGTSASTITATGDNVNGTLVVTPGSGFAFYPTSSNQTNDWEGFKMTLGSDGNLYYTTLGPTTYNSSNGVVQAGAGGLHQFNPTTFTDSEITLPVEVEDPLYASDGGVWVGSFPAPGASPAIYRVPATSFNNSSLQQFNAPGASAGANANIRSFAQDSVGNIWMTDIGSFRYLKVPVGGPYATNNTTVYPAPTKPPTVNSQGHFRRVDFAGGDVVFSDASGYEVVVNPSTGAVINTAETNLQVALGSNTIPNTYDTSSDGTYVYLGEIGDANANIANGALEKFNPNTLAFTTLPIQPGPVEAVPDIPKVNGNLIYYADFPNAGLGLTNLTTSTTRFMPMEAYSNVTIYSFTTFPDGLVAMPDGTAWFTCYGNADNVLTTGTTGVTYKPMCVGHTVYVAAWGLWPGSTFSLFGGGAAGAQIVGIMEAPTANSGPFTATTSNAAVCTVSTPTDHNFTVTGVAAGSCTITVTDAHAVSQQMTVTVTTTSGTVQSRKREVARP